MDRRKFLKTGSGMAASATLLPFQAQTGLKTQGVEAKVTPGSRHFPPGFRWGTATASYQVEGGVYEEGRKPSIWDTFSHVPGNVRNGDTGDVADDYFHRYKEDIALMKTLGVTAYRFSIAWSRVFPDGTGAPNRRGLDFYKRVLDELQGAGIEPFCTLYHWDLPQTLQDRWGGWQSRETGKAFADYCAYTVAQLADRITNFMTMNEMSAFVWAGYGDGHSAPGLSLGAAEVARVSHNVVLAHGMAVRAIRAAGKPSTLVGIPANAVATTPIIETEEHIKAAQIALREENAPFLSVILDGRYTDAYLRRLGAATPTYTPEELAIISSPLDFVGFNVYYPTYIRADHNELGYSVVKPPSSYPKMHSEWLSMGPESIYWTPKLAVEVWNLRSIYITENGCPSDDQMSRDGHIYDSDRVMYLRNYLTQLERATSEGVPVKGYFLWSLLDNFEWSSGYDKRFGITYVDYKTLRRTPKLSFDFYRSVIVNNRVT